MTALSRSVTTATILTLVLAACSTKPAATTADALPCGPVSAHFPELDKVCSAFVGCAIFKATIPACEPGATKVCACTMCSNNECVEQICIDCADTAAAVDIAADATDADSQAVDAAPSGADLAVTDTPPDVKLLPKQQASSFQACLCWKQGDDCNLQGGPYLPKDPSKLCPADEVCDGDFSHLYPSGNVAGQCHKLCALAGVGVAGTQDCAATEKCEARAIVSGFEGQTIVTVALCVPATTAEGTDQTDAGSGEK